ncbi:MAG: hypothetical protein HY541_05960, partial [Deltaproteobacteria bacterium]|nr:hypothetical protein [Deltaproteobacteria bacterium]
SPGNGEVNGTLSSGSTDSTGSDESGEVNDIHFTEVVTDPQQDWSDTTGGDAIAFDSIVGTGTVGTTDEWIEIKNGRDETVDLTLWRLEMLDGTDAAELFSSSSASFVFFDGGDINNFQPDEFLVIGNPSGDLKNEVTLQLFDGSDFLVDELVIDDANASGISDESYQLTDDGNWGMGEATVGF